MSLRDNSILFHMESNYKQHSLMSTAFAIIGLELMRSLNKIDKIITFQKLKSFQDPKTGFFIDPQLSNPDKNIWYIEKYYLHYQTTAFMLSAIDALGGKAEYNFRFLSNYKSKNYIIEWLNNLDWKNPWHQSNKIMFILQFLSYEYIIFKDNKSFTFLINILDWLDEFQDPETGFWGTNKGSSLYNAMAGAFHFLMFYFYFKRSLKFNEKMIDSVLKIQSKDGLFYPFGGGGACEDVDAIDILVKLSSITDYKNDEIKSALYKAYKKILTYQNSDGGFCWARRPSYSLHYSYRYLNPFSKLYNFNYAKFVIKRSILSPFVDKYKESNILLYSGWDKMKFKVSESDIWSTWFRLLALALIESKYPELKNQNINFKFRRLPALGWHFNE